MHHKYNTACNSLVSIACDMEKEIKQLLQKTLLLASDLSGEIAALKGKIVFESTTEIGSKLRQFMDATSKLELAERLDDSDEDKATNVHQLNLECTLSETAATTMIAHFRAQLNDLRLKVDSVLEDQKNPPLTSALSISGFLSSQLRQVPLSREVITQLAYLLFTHKDDNTNQPKVWRTSEVKAFADYLDSECERRGSVILALVSWIIIEDKTLKDTNVLPSDPRKKLFDNAIVTLKQIIINKYSDNMALEYIDFEIIKEVELIRISHHISFCFQKTQPSTALAQDEKNSSEKNAQLKKYADEFDIEFPQAFNTLYLCVVKKCQGAKALQAKEMDLAIVYSLLFDVMNLKQQWLVQKINASEDLKHDDKVGKIAAFNTAITDVVKILKQCSLIGESVNPKQDSLKGVTIQMIVHDVVHYLTNVIYSKSGPFAGHVATFKKLSQFFSASAGKDDAETIISTFRGKLQDQSYILDLLDRMETPLNNVNSVNSSVVVGSSNHNAMPKNLSAAGVAAATAVAPLDHKVSLFPSVSAAGNASTASAARGLGGHAAFYPQK